MPFSNPPDGATALSIVVPCFNEEAVLRETHARLSRLLDRLVAAGKISSRSDIVVLLVSLGWNPALHEWEEGENNCGRNKTAGLVYLCCFSSSSSSKSCLL